ncbi:hypothetical protein BGZ61DRAFT_445495 [Ilyonectria robusta]|uniref:uncharacterized protein n=1 Tax=Ilyonectria robusta TaxID=1079257 RepID=UPI001E8EB17B|nr:uncharacterized protein BGZ61DRAFT_445495 [Ilyonectria robusta]KAH8733905.1 hypothetical protein BGZ61DRAFT_445495 [Ilyonectria robusta]
MSQSGSQCDLTGNPDLYGIGVRIGLYSQWIATLLVTLFDSRNEGAYRVVNLIMQCAIFLGLCTDSSQGGSAVGSIVTQLLLCGSLSSLTGNGISHSGSFSGICRVLFYIALSSYGCWFWYTGIDEMTIPNCPEQIAFFGRTSINGRFRVFGKAAAVIGLVSSVALLGWNIFAVVLRLNGNFKHDRASRAGKRPQVEIGLLMLSIGLIAFSVGGVEYLIDVNDISGLSDINSVGQFLPLLVGTIACFQTLWTILFHGYIWRKRCWFLLGRHL